MHVAPEDPRALQAFEAMIRNSEDRGMAADEFLKKLGAIEPTNPEFLYKTIDAEWQLFLKGWKAAMEVAGGMGPY